MPFGESRLCFAKPLEDAAMTKGKHDSSQSRRLVRLLHVFLTPGLVLFVGSTTVGSTEPDASSSSDHAIGSNPRPQTQYGSYKLEPGRKGGSIESHQKKSDHLIDEPNAIVEVLLSCIMGDTEGLLELRIVSDKNCDLPIGSEDQARGSSDPGS